MESVDLAEGREAVKHGTIPPWDDPTRSPEERREEWLKGHFRPEFLHRDRSGRLQADFEALGSWRRDSSGKRRGGL